jgi:hypothetical protein
VRYEKPSKKNQKHQVAEAFQWRSQPAGMQ